MAVYPLPAVVVEIDTTNPTRVYPDSGGYIAAPADAWTDISAFVRFAEGITIRRGRTDWVGQIQPGTCTLTLETTTGKFTPGHPNALTGLGLRDRIRVTVGGSVRFVGYVNSWPIVWPTGGDELATVTVTAVDGTGTVLARQLRSFQAEVLLEKQPTALYVLSEGSGSARASDISGNAQPDLVLTAPATPRQNQTFQFGQGTGVAADGASAAQWVGGNQAYQWPDGYTLTSASDMNTAPNGARSGSVGLFLVANTQPMSANGADVWGNLATFRGVGGYVGLASYTQDGYTGSFGVARGTSYSPAVAQPGYSAAVNTYGWGTKAYYAQFGAAQWTTAGEIGTNSITAPGGWPNAAFSANGRLELGDPNLNLTLSYVAVWTETQPGNLYQLCNEVELGLGGWSDPIGRLLDFAGAPTARRTLDKVSLPSVAPFDITGQTVAAVIGNIADAAGDRFFCSRAGNFVYQAGRFHTATSSVVLDVAQGHINADWSVILDEQGIANQASVTNPSNTASANYTNAASVAQFGVRPASSVTIPTNDKGTLIARAQWRANATAVPAMRSPTLTVDLLTLSSAVRSAVQGLELGDRFEVNNPPIGQNSLGLIMQGYAETISADSWYQSINATPAGVEDVLIWDDPVFGQWDRTHDWAY